MADTKGKAARFMLIKLLTEGMVTSSEIEAVANVKNQMPSTRTSIKSSNGWPQWKSPSSRSMIMIGFFG